MGPKARGSGRSWFNDSIRDGEACLRATTMWPSLEAVRTPMGSVGLAVSPTGTRHSEEKQRET